LTGSFAVQCGTFEVSLVFRTEDCAPNLRSRASQTDVRACCQGRAAGMSPTNSFFDESREQSIIKAKIVKDYFWAWAKVIIGSLKRSGRGEKIAYIDLFAGPGRYKDGTKSTPLLILETAIADPEMRRRLVTIFNDKNSDNSKSLEGAIELLPGIEKLKYKPSVENEEVGEKIVAMFRKMSLVPTLFFVDPWGYKGLTLQLVNSVLKDWGCDCIVFFNYNRINMGLTNPAVKSHLDALFGPARAAELRQKLPSMNSTRRETTIVEYLAQALKGLGGKYVLPFCFKNETGTRTSHHLIFVSKHFKGYEIMKDIMAKQSSTSEQGVPSFTYSPADEQYHLLFALSRPLHDLEDMLATDLAGQTLTVKEIYEMHSVDRPYVKKNYRDVLRKMEATGAIRTDPPASERPMRNGERTFADHVIVKFPKRRK
jgi:three-Cys-motif partner protein